MLEKWLSEIENLTTPHLADGCMATGVPIRCAPAGVQSLRPGQRMAGPAQPVRHVGSIDIFFEAIDRMPNGAVLVVDNDGRTDEACIGDIVLLEAKAAGAAGFVLWGLHRDSAELREIDFPVFSLGSLPNGPQRLHARPPDAFERAIVGMHTITPRDIVIGDTNGVLFIAEDRLEQVVSAAKVYRETEARQLSAMRSGRTFREVIRFSDYVAKRNTDPSYGLRAHLKAVSAAGEV